MKPLFKDFSFQVLAKNSFLFGLFPNEKAASEVQDNKKFSLYCWTLSVYGSCVYLYEWNSRRSDTFT